MAKRTFWILLAWTAAGFLARATGSHLFALGGVTPDLLTLIVVYWALAGGPLAGTTAGFVVGLVADAEVGRHLGLTSGCLAAVGYMVGNAGGSLHRDGPVAQAVLLLVATVFVLSVRTLFAVGGSPGAWFAVLPADVLLRALYTALLGPVFYLVGRLVGVPNFLAHGPATATPRG
jgi:rod shape-determining protein MreD